MNNIYHKICSYKNWEKYLHLATVQGTCEKVWSDSEWRWNLDTTISFYYNSRFNRKTFKTVPLSHEHYPSVRYLKEEVETRFNKMLEGDVARLAELLASDEYRKAMPTKADPNKDLVPIAELCLLVPGTPVEVSNFILKFLEINKPIKKV